MEGTVTSPAPHSSTHTMPDRPMTYTQVDALIETRMKEFANQLEQRLKTAERQADVKQKLATYGVGGVAGLVAGIGGTLLVQRIRRRGGGGHTKP